MNPRVMHDILDLVMADLGLLDTWTKSATARTVINRARVRVREVRDALPVVDGETAMAVGESALLAGLVEGGQAHD